mgnify:CR=1 FL=1
MPKEGLHRNVHYHSDPTYEQVLAKYQKEQKEAARENRAMTAFRVIATVRILVKNAVYQLMTDLIMADSKPGVCYTSSTEEEAKHVRRK